MFPYEAQQFVNNCFTGEAASCTFACPFHIDVRSFLKKAARGRWDSCYKDLMSAVSFPSVACRLCGKECERYCQRSTLGDAPVQLKEIELACIAHSKKHVPEVFSAIPKEQTVAVIGAGPSGLAAAFQLAQKQYPVTVFEKGSSIGGCLREHPDFSIFYGDMAEKLQAAGVTVTLNKEISDLSLLSDFSAIVIATGKGGNGFGLAEGRSPGHMMTSVPGTFACGELCGADACGALAEGNALASCVEAYLISGNSDFAVTIWDKKNCSRYVDHSGAASVSPIVKSGELFSKDEAKAEAARCLQCDCTACMQVCEHLKKYKKNPLKYASEVYMDSQVRPPITGHSATNAVYACNLCGRCSKVCPEKTDLPGLFCFSRQNRRERNDYPPAFHDFWLGEQDYASGEAAFSFTPDDGTCQYVFFPGCQLGAANPLYVEKAYEFLRNSYGASILSCCCGAPSYWGGDAKRLDKNTERIRAAWEKMGHPVFVTACSSCTKMLTKILPEIQTESLYALLDRQGLQGRLEDAFQTVSVFDPCAVSDTSDAADAVRSLAVKSGAAVSDYRSDGKCCGYGGHMRIADPALYEEIIRNRASDSEYPYLVYCVNCREVFRSQKKECRHILEAVFDFDGGPTPTLQEKRENSMKVKIHLLDKYKKESFSPESHPWDSLALFVPAEVREKMENKLLTDDDAKECIWKAEQTGEGFFDEQEQLYLACLVRSALTYWFCYRKDETGYTLADAYCHRMHFRENE